LALEAACSRRAKWVWDDGTFEHGGPSSRDQGLAAGSFDAVVASLGAAQDLFREPALRSPAAAAAAAAAAAVDHWSHVVTSAERSVRRCASPEAFSLALFARHDVGAEEIVKHGRNGGRGVSFSG